MTLTAATDEGPTAALTEPRMICHRVGGMKPFLAMDILEHAQELERAGEHVIHLELGEPDFDTPQAIKEAGIAAIRRGDTHYTHSLGAPRLREAISEHYARTYGIDPPHPDRVLITSGSSPAFLVAMSTLLESGDELILSDPHYACHPNFVRYLGATPRTIPVFEDDGFQYRPHDIRAALTSRTKAILINSPANPTGTLLAPERMAEIAELAAAAASHPWIFSDEIYHGLVYQGRARSILEFTDRCLVFNGFSKLFAMTGWRLGYVIVPRDLVRPMQTMLQNFFISASSIAQAAAYAALTDPAVEADVAAMVREYRERRLSMLAGLRKLGFGIAAEPTGAFYVFANAGRFSSDSNRLARDILEKAKVGVTPGVDFGPHGEGYLRFSYANSLENIGEGLRRIGEYLAGR